jgi:DNA-binding response OmpR family regulator
MEAKRQNITLTLTAQEFKLLKFFARSPGGFSPVRNCSTRCGGTRIIHRRAPSITTSLRLRQKLEPDPGHPRYFLTTHGAGYKFTLHAAAASGEK